MFDRAFALVYPTRRRGMPDGVPEEVTERPANERSPVAAGAPATMPPWIPRAILLAFAAVVAFFFGWWVLRELRTLIIMVFVALFLSLAMEPAVAGLARRGWRRGPATLLVLGGVVIGIIVFAAAAGSVVVGQVNDLADNAPSYVRDLERFVNDDLGIEWDADNLVREIRSGDAFGAVDTDTIVSNALDLGVAIAAALLEIITVLIFAFYMTADGPRMRRTICSRLPERHQTVVLDTWELAIDKTGGYIYSRGIQAVISALVTWAFLVILDVPYGLALGLWVGIVSQFIPTVGTYIAMVLPVLVALAQDPIDALWVLLFLVLYQQFENYVLGPRITKRTMEIHPALAIGTVFAGGLLLGGVGAVLALPTAAVVQAVIAEHTPQRALIEGELLEEPRPRKRRFTRWRRRLRKGEIEVDEVEPVDRSSS
jgi:predicted PurR-regulated permease PerM